MNWPLTHDHFNILDRIKLASFVLNKNNFWTRSTQTDLFEKEMARSIGLKSSPQPIFVSSGSTANTLIAMYWQDHRVTDKCNKIVFPATTWSTSVTPFIREGFEPIFVDIDPQNLFIDTDKLREVLDTRDDIYGVFATTLLGYANRSLIKEARNLCKDKGIKFALDNCESNFSDCFDICLCTTSTYFSHFVQSCEGGFVFPETEDQRDYFLTLMNHGMPRFCKKKPKENLFVDDTFRFITLGNNFRNSDLHARVGRLSLKKSLNIIKHRADLLLYFVSRIEDKEGFLINNYNFLFNMAWSISSTPFCLPLVFESSGIKDHIENVLNKEGVETRPIISGNLLYHDAFIDYTSYAKDCPYSSEITQTGFYVGLHEDITYKHIDYLIKKIRRI